MASLKVDKAGIADIARQMAELNTEMDNGFDTLLKDMNSLHASWTGTASHEVQDNFQTIKTKYQVNRKNVISNYVNVLSGVVNKGFLDTELENKRIGQLADLFK